jgi:hypothetical protein
MARRTFAVATRFMDSGDASSVGRDHAEQFHDEQLQWRKRRTAGVIKISAHGLSKRCPHGGIASVFCQARHDSENRIAPLAERHEIVEALKDDVLLAEMTAVSGILQPIPGHGPFGILGFAGLDIAYPIIDP